MIKVSDYIAKFFVKRSIDKCFVVTGGGAMHLNDSFGHNANIDCIYNHHEQACAMAAEGYSRLSGKPALVSVTSGPGATNAITGVLGAWLDSIPMIVLSGQMTYNTTLKSSPIPLRQLGFQEFNIIDSVECMTKYAVMITDPKYIAYHLERAYQEATSGRKGPVWLDIPLDVQSAMVEESELIHYTLVSDKKEFQQVVDQEIVSDILDRINQAKKPVILAGYGVRMSDSYEEFLAAVSKLQIPVVTEWNSNDLIWKDHPFYAGRPGTIGDRGGNFVLQNADLVLVLGCQLSIRQISYAWKNFAKNAYKIGVDADRSELIKPTVKIDYPVQADIKAFLKAINTSSTTSTHDIETYWYKWCRDINKKYPVVVEQHYKDVSPISVYAFMKSLSSHLDGNDAVVLANGAACVAGLQAIDIKQGQRVFTNAGASSMGYGVAAAIGASYSRDGKDRVICIEGDGSIQMNLQELQTIIHNKLNIKIFWINNDGYHSIKQTQTTLFNAKEKGYCGANKDSGISFPSAEKIANAYGFPFIRIDNINDLDFKLTKVCTADGPLLCEVVTNPEEQFQPKLQSKLLEDGTFQTPSLEDMYPFLTKEEIRENSFRR